MSEMLLYSVTAKVRFSIQLNPDTLIECVLDVPSLSTHLTCLSRHVKGIVSTGERYSRPR